MKALYDAMMFDGQPSLKSRGFLPARFVSDGALNATTNPPQGAHLPGSEFETFAWERNARVSVGIEADYAYDQHPRPAAYKGQGILIIDQEAAELLNKPKAEVLAHFKRGTDAARKQWRAYGKSNGIYIYAPWLPFAEVLPCVDGVALDCYLHSDDLSRWRAFFAENVAKTQGKPIVAGVFPQYAYWADEGIRWQPLPLALWSEWLTWLLRQKEVAALCLWGGPTKEAFEGKVWGRLPWSFAEPYVKAALAARRAA